MDDQGLSRAEYPAMLASLQPSQAVSALNDRVKRISKLNIEIADWLQERRKVEELYVQGLRKLTQFKVPNAQSELGTFQVQWDKILASAEGIAFSHHQFATKIEKDVEAPLRNFSSKPEMQNIQTIQGNLASMAKELDTAQERSDKLMKKGGKANTAKVEQATAQLESATQQWESQAPFVFETLQALDETRWNHLRDVLTQYGTYEGEQGQAKQADAEGVLNSLLDFKTENEIARFADKTTSGKPKLEKRPTMSRQTTNLATGTAGSTLAPPSITTPDEDGRSETSGTKEGGGESKLRRLGTMLGRRRQSIHGGFGQLSPQKTPFSRNIKSSHGISPRASSSNLAESNNRLSSLAERPDSSEEPPSTADTREKPSHDGTNGVGATSDLLPERTSSQINGAGAIADLSGIQPPSGPPPGQKEPEKDAEGFTVPAAFNDPISQAQAEAAGEESDQLFKLNIQKEPIAEEDPEEKKAALSNVASTLTAMGLPSRKAGTIRGRRDVRNTIYIPAPGTSEGSETGNPFPSPPNLSTGLSGVSKPAAVAALASEASIAGTSDTQSIRSATSLGNMVHFKHPDLNEAGLNSSILETVSAVFESGQVQSVKISGEIAFSFNATDSSSPNTHQTVRINNFPSLEAIGPNRIFVQNHTPDHPDQFTLDLSHISSSKPTVGFSYRSHIEEGSFKSLVPILLNPAWKPQGDKLGLLLQYKANPAYKFAGPITLRHVVFFATYENARASGAQTKPSGTHLKDKHLVYWRLGDLTLNVGQDWQKIVCRVVGEQGAEPKPGKVEARWEYSPPTEADASEEISISKLGESKGKGKEVQELDDDDPFADVGEASSTNDQSWVDVQAVRNIISGKYEAK